MNKVTRFIATVVALAAGNDVQVIALRNERKSNAAFKGTIAGLEGKKVEAEEAVEMRKEALQKATYPITDITDSDEYLQNIRTAQAQLETAEQALVDVNDSIEFWSNLLKRNAEETNAA